ncbi:MAG: 4-hydroxy-tetrahydrodipicolinate reductase, partial [Bdellovibrionales bacterium]
MITVVGITGYTGRMGQAIAEACHGHSSACLAGGVTRSQVVPCCLLDNSELLITDNPQELFPRCDVIIDFSHHTVTPVYARLAAKEGKPFLTGTTNIDQPTKELLKEISGTIPVLHTSNTSLSLVVTEQIVALTASLLKEYDFDISILDKHHKWKKDMPSGTARALGEATRVGNDWAHEPTYASLRTGSIVGEHEVMFAGKGETITITHSVTDRRV